MSGTVTRRPNETRSDWRKRQRIAQNVQTYGLRVRCTSCGAGGRHRANVHGPLNERPCPKCGGKLGKVSGGWVPNIALVDRELDAEVDRIVDEMTLKTK